MHHARSLQTHPNCVYFVIDLKVLSLKQEASNPVKVILHPHPHVHDVDIVPEIRPSGLKIEHVSKPDACEKTAKNGNTLTMHYTGTLQSDGTKFDSSVDRNKPFKFQLGVGQV